MCTINILNLKKKWEHKNLYILVYKTLLNNVTMKLVCGISYKAELNLT